MSPFDVPPNEMGIDPEIANDELEALLAGHGRDKNLDLARFVDDLSTAFPARAPASAEHLAAIADEAQLLADKGDPVARPPSNAVAPIPRASRLPKRWRHTMEDRKARILIKIAAPVVALFAVLGIMGSAGALPRALQHLTSNAAGVVGLNLPTGDEGNDATDTSDQGDQNDRGGSSSTGTSDQGDQNDQGDSTSSDSTDQGDQNDQGDSTSTGSSDQGDQGFSTGSSDPTDQGDQNDQGGSSSTGSSDQADQNDQGDSTGTSNGGSPENDQGGGGATQDNQGDSSGNSSSTSGDGGSGSTSGDSSGSGDNQN
jgi:hypothetical protein